MKRARLALLLVFGMLAALLPMAAVPAGADTSGDLVITGVVDGPLTGGIPKGIELFVVSDIPDLSIYGLGSANNGGGTDGQEFAFPAVAASSGAFIYVATEATAFTSFFGFAPDYTNATAPSINGDDAIELFMNGVVVDVFGDIGTSGSGQPWDYLDGWAYRVDGSGQDGTTFDESNWTFSGINALDGETTNASATTPFPIGTFLPISGIVGPSDPVINEFSASTAGADVEYVEIFGDAGTDYSAYTIIEIEGDSSGAGVVDAAISLGTTDSGGFFLVDLPDGLLENGTITLLLVENFSGSGGADLDTNNDGVFDSSPWDTIVDAVAVSDGGASDRTYGVAVLGPNYDGVSSFAPGGASRIPDGFDTDSATDWVRNDFDLAGIPEYAGTPVVGEALNTPGTSNQIVTPTAPPVVINEVDADTPSDDVAEFIELYDGGVGNVALDGLSVVLFNGSDDLSYTPGFDLDGFSTDADGYFVIGSVPGADIDVAPGSFGWLQNGADAVALLTGDAVDYPNDTPIPASALIDAIVYDTNDGEDAGLLVLLNAGQPQVNEGGAGDKDNHSNQRCPNGSGGARNTDTYAQFAPTPGAVNECQAPPEPPTEVKIHDVQGNGAASPLVGETVVVEGIVVGDFQDGASGTNGDLNGFHVQEEDVDADGDPMTSEGIFVFDGSSPAVDVAIGDLVRVEGSVSEFNGLTEITSFSGVSVLGSGNSLPTAATLSLPVAAVDDFERYEGMYVTFPQALVISEYFNFDRFGEIVLTTDRRLTPTAEVEPGPASVLAAEDFLLNKITLDDGRTNQNPDPAIHPNGGVFDLTNLFRGGDTVANVTGVMDYGFNLYRIQPTQGAEYTNTNLRTAAPDDVGGNLKVATFNVLNYFTTLDNAGPICGPAGDQDCRGADDVDEFTRQRDKIIAALTEMNADVVGLLEIENNVNDDAVIDLVNGLNIVNGPGAYDYVATGAIGTDAIKVALIYKPASVFLEGGYAVLDSSVDPRFIDTKNRPALAQTFMDSTTGGVFTVAVNHLKSKGSACDDVGDPDTGDGAGNCNLTRKAAAEALVDWLITDPTGSGDEDFLIIGDLNSYDKEDPIDAIVAGGYTDLIYQFIGEDAYSYVFDGQIGYLDHALANVALLGKVTGATVWHINADEPDLIDYDTSFKQAAQDAIYAPDAYRSSDHDPVIVGLDVRDEIAPTVEAEFDTIWAGYYTGLFKVDYSCTDNFDSDPTCVGDINGIKVKDGQKVFLITSRRSWDRRIGKILYVAAPTFVLTVESTDFAGNTASATDKPEFRTRWWWN